MLGPRNALGKGGLWDYGGLWGLVYAAVRLTEQDVDQGECEGQEGAGPIGSLELWRWGMARVEVWTLGYHVLERGRYSRGVLSHTMAHKITS